LIAHEWETLARGNPTEAHFRRVASDLYQHMAGKPLHFHSCGEWLESWLKSTKSSVSERTYDRYSGTIDDFRKFLGERDKAPLASITPDEVTAYRDQLQKRGLAASTVNLCIRKTIAAPFESARRLGYITVNPCAPVKAVKDKVAKSQARRRPFTSEQIGSLLTTSRSEKWKDTGWEGAILCGMTTALRLGDIVNLTWGEIDLGAETLTTAAKKTGEELKIPLHSAFVAWLGKQTRGIGKAPVFPKLHGRSIGGANGLSRKFKKLMDEAGVVGEIIREGGTAEQRKDAKAGAGRTITALSFHSLRHTATSLMANAGVAADTRKAITGHRDDRVHENYTHHELEKLREAVGLITVPGGGAETPTAQEKPKKPKTSTKKRT
jgi:integrase